MNLIDHYNSLWLQSKNEILNNKYQIDNFLNKSFDTRRGITLLARLEFKVLNKIIKFIEKCKTIEPDQYYYKSSDIHITILTIISCYENFTIDLINRNDYIEIIKKALSGINNFKIQFKGITASDSCIMIKGFPLNNDINIIRENLRKNFKSSKLTNSIDKRYRLITAHSTIIRFKNNLKNPIKLIELIERYKDYNFGYSNIKELEFIFTDWYQRNENNKTLFTFKLL